MPSLYVVLVEKLPRLVIERVVGIGVEAASTEVGVKIAKVVELTFELGEAVAGTPIVVKGIVKVRIVGVCNGEEDADKDKDWADGVLETVVLLANVKLMGCDSEVADICAERVVVDAVVDEVGSIGVTEEVWEGSAELVKNIVRDTDVLELVG